MAVTAKDADVHVEAVFPGSLEESVKGFEGEGVVALIAAWHNGEQGQIVSVLVNNEMVVTVAKKKAVAVGIIAPLGSGRGIIAIVLAAIDPLRAAGTGGFSRG